jgi:hypothetical protein
VPASSSCFADSPARPEAVPLALVLALGPVVPLPDSVVAFVPGSGAVDLVAEVGLVVGLEQVSVVRVGDQIAVAVAVAAAAAVVAVVVVVELAEAEEMHGGSWQMEDEAGPAVVGRLLEVLDLRFGCDCSVANVHSAWQWPAPAAASGVAAAAAAPHGVLVVPVPVPWPQLAGDRFAVGLASAGAAAEAAGGVEG